MSEEELTFHEIVTRLQEDLGVSKTLDVLVLANASAFGDVEGGPETIAGAVMAAAGTVVVPAFTYQTQIVPQVGPPNNGIIYGESDAQNLKAEIFRPDLPVHPDCGVVAEALRQDNDSLRSTHPVLSFAAQGPKAREVLSAQTLENPFGPVAWLEAHDGAVLLLGTDHRENVALHLAEQRAGRRTFTRWALTLGDVEELHNMPGCREGFRAISQYIADITLTTMIGMARCESVPIPEMLQRAEQTIREDPDFLLCNKPSCILCNARRAR
jgi:aminoglycoside N3'-acetyltransferase